MFSLLSHIEVGLAHFPASQDLEDLVHAAVESNVQHSIQELMKIEDLQRAVQNGRLNVVGAVYDLHTGKVRFLDHNK